MRYLLDSDAGKPEKCEEGIWVMGILHEGWRPPSEEMMIKEEGGGGEVAFSVSSRLCKTLVPQGRKEGREH